MNILLFIDGLGSGGAQRQFTQLAHGLAQRGHRVTVAVYNDQDHYADDIRRAGIEIVRLAKPSRFSLRPIVELGKLYRRCSAEVVIAFLRSPAAKAEMARVLFPEMKVIAAERSAYPARLSAIFRLTQRLHGLARFITVNSHNQMLAMRREFPQFAGRVVTIRNGVDLPQAPLPDRNTDPRELRLVAVSSLMPYKNSVRLAEAVALVREEHRITARISWAGETFERTPGYGAYQQTCDRIGALGLEDQWHWLGVRRDIPDILARHDALIHPSLFEGTSNAVCEAMAMGLPVLAGNVADHEEMLAGSGAGILFDPLDVRSMADAIGRFALLDDSQRRKMGNAGRKLIENNYSFDQMVSDYEILASAAARGDKDPPGELSSRDGR